MPTPVTYENYYGDIYYLIRKKTKKGNWRYYFAKSKKGKLTYSIPDGYEIDEKPDGKVYLIKEIPQFISEQEKALVENSVEKYSEVEYFRVYVKKEKLTINLAQDSVKSLKKTIGHLYDENKFRKFLTFTPMLQFVLVDKTNRIFEVRRYCFRGAIDDWIFLDEGNLKEMAKQYCKYLGKESFYDLI